MKKLDKEFFLKRINDAISTEDINYIKYLLFKSLTSAPTDTNKTTVDDHLSILLQDIGREGSSMSNTISVLINIVEDHFE